MSNITVKTSIANALTLIGGKWKAIIIASLLEEKKRFNELKKMISGITQRSLVIQLRELEKDQIIVREESQSKNKIYYGLTKLGMSFESVINELLNWNFLVE